MSNPTPHPAADVGGSIPPELDALDMGEGSSDLGDGVGGCDAADGSGDALCEGDAAPVDAEDVGPDVSREAEGDE